MAILNVDAGVIRWSHRPSCVNIRPVAASATAVHRGFALTVDMNSADVMAMQIAARFDMGAPIVHAKTCHEATRVPEQ
jgi:hypothetical protein